MSRFQPCLACHREMCWVSLSSFYIPLMFDLVDDRLFNVDDSTLLAVIYIPPSERLTVAIYLH